MKILKITYEWPPPWVGLVAHPFELTKSQARKGHEMYVMSGRWPRNGPVVEPQGIKLIHFLNNSSLPFRTPAQGLMAITVAPLVLLRYLWWRRTNQIDLLHCHGHFAMWVYWYRNFLANYFPRSKELRVPLIVHFHNTVEGRWRALNETGKKLNFLTEKLDWPLALMSDKFAVKNADALVFVSQQNLDEAIEYYDADPNKCFLVESGVNPDLFIPMGQVEREKIHKDLGLDAEDKLIVNIGMMVERKNIHLLVESLLHLPPKYKLLLAGPTPDLDYKDQIDEFIKNHGLKDRVLFSGYQPYPDVPILYQGADIFVLPSSFEGTPKVVMEALACAVPVLGSAFKLSINVPGIFYLDEVTPKSIAENIYKIVEPTVFVDRDKFVSTYSWDSRAQLLEPIYTAAEQNRAIALEKVLGRVYE